MAKILIVDDSSFMRKIISNVMESAGHIIVGEACNANEAMEKYAKLKPNLVIMDVNMGDISGVEGLRRIKILDKKAKIVMCSSMGQQSIIRECLQEGALDFIVKPFNKQKILEITNNALRYEPKYQNIT